MEEALLAAFSTLTAAITGVGGILWKIHKANTGNGHSQEAMVTALHGIKESIEMANHSTEKALTIIADQAEKQTVQYVTIASGIAVLVDRSRNG